MATFLLWPHMEEKKSSGLIRTPSHHGGPTLRTSCKPNHVPILEATVLGVTASSCERGGGGGMSIQSITPRSEKAGGRDRGSNHAWSWKLQQEQVGAPSQCSFQTNGWSHRDTGIQGALRLHWLSGATPCWHSMTVRALYSNPVFNLPVVPAAPNGEAQRSLPSQVGPGRVSSRMSRDPLSPLTHEHQAVLEAYP